MRECEDNSRSVYSRRASRLDLVIGSRLASRQNGTHVKHVEGGEGSCQLLHYRTKLSVWLGS